MEKEQQINEAVRRMKALNIHENAIKEFETKQLLNRSEGPGILFWLSDEEKKIVEDFEKERGGMVYHVILSNTVELGPLYSLLYVSNYPEEWEVDMKDIENKDMIAYVYNVNEPLFSEIGYIEIQPRNGGVIRIA